MDKLLDPQFIAEIAVLITAITGLIVALQNRTSINKTQSTIEQVHENTNGALANVQAKLTAATLRPVGSRRSTDPPPPATQEPHQSTQ